MNRAILYILVLGLLQGCGASKGGNNSPEQIAQLTQLVVDKSYRFNATKAHPMQTQAFTTITNSGILPPGTAAGTIDVTTITSFIEIHGDSITGNLPFYGERQFGGGPTAVTGIQVKGRPKSFKETYNSKKERFNLRIEIEGNQELFQLNLIIFPNGPAQVAVVSKQRNSIRYVGAITAIESDIKE